MNDVIKITLPVDDSVLQCLRAGDKVELTGWVYTGRDAAHKRLCELLAEGRALPFDIKGQAIYYVGPAPAKPGYAVGSAGPTTSYRMDSYTLPLLEQGLKLMIGKGQRSRQVIDGMIKHKAAYLGVVGGVAALVSRSIKQSEVIAYPELGAEAVHRFYVQDFPAMVIIDCDGTNLYETEPPKYRISDETSSRQGANYETITQSCL